MINVTILIAIGALALLAYYKGSRILLSVIVAFYPSSMLYASLPIKDSLLFLGKDGVSLFYSHAAIFGIIFLLVFWAVFRIMGHENLGYGTARWINALLIGGSVVLATLALTFHILPAYNIFQIQNSGIVNFWASDWGYFTAMVVPIVAILKVAGGSRRGGFSMKKFKGSSSESY
jgi:hypothetical protein